MFSVGFKPAIPNNRWLQTYALDCAAFRIGMLQCNKLQLRGYTQFFNSCIIIIIIILNLIKKKIHILTCSDMIYFMEKLN
jgi:hypothetical protein